MQVPKSVTGAYLVMFLQVLVNKSVNMAKQLYNRKYIRKMEIYLYVTGSVKTSTFA